MSLRWRWRPRRGGASSWRSCSELARACIWPSRRRPPQNEGARMLVWAPKQERAARMSRSSRPVRPPGQFTDGLSRVPTIEHMTIQPMDHVGIVVDDLADAVAFFVELGLELQGEAPVEGDWVDRVVGLEGVRAQIAMLQTPDGHGRLELTKFTRRRRT